MNLQQIVKLVLVASIFLSVLALGLQAWRESLRSMLRSPGEVVRALVSMNVMMPLFAIVLAAVFNLNPALKVALVTVAVSPVSPLIPRKELKTGGRQEFVVGLFALTALLAIVTVPGAIHLVGRMFGIPMEVAPAAVGKTVLLTVLAPLALGAVIRWLAPDLAHRIAHPVGLVGAVLLGLGAIALLVSSFPGMISLIGNGTLLAISGLVVAGLGVGHLLGGPALQDRIVVALSSASRHPAVALTAATAVAPAERLAGPAVLLYLIVATAIGTGYAALVRRRHPAGIVGAPPTAHPGGAA